MKEELLTKIQTGIDRLGVVIALVTAVLVGSLCLLLSPWASILGFALTFGGVYLLSFLTNWVIRGFNDSTIPPKIRDIFVRNLILASVLPATLSIGGIKTNEYLEEQAQIARDDEFMQRLIEERKIKIGKQ